MNIQNCPLCRSSKASEFFADKWRSYMRCRVCELIFVPSSQLLSEEEEKSRYDLHQNSPDDQGYRAFLGRLFDPMQKLLAPGSKGLDFGSGPGPTLSVMFREAGHSAAIYDYYYARDTSLLDAQYDFITATEVLEHLHRPGDELEVLWGCLKDGGNMGVMTKLALGREDFARWHYKDDLTHVCFYSSHTFEWLRGRWNAGLTFVDKDAAIFFKKQ